MDIAWPVYEADLVRFRAPVDPHKELKIFHSVPFDQSPQRAATMPSGPCTGALGANSPLGVHHGQETSHRSPQVLKTQGGDGLLSVPWPGSSRIGEKRMMAGCPDELQLPSGFPSALRAPVKPEGSSHRRHSLSAVRGTGARFGNDLAYPIQYGFVPGSTEFPRHGHTLRL